MDLCNHPRTPLNENKTHIKYHVDTRRRRRRKHAVWRF